MSFAPFLADLERELDVPYPERRELLDEIGAHLEQLCQAMMQTGADVEEATARAIQTLAADQDFVHDIGEVHRSAIARALARLPRKVSLGIEYTLISATGALLVAGVLWQEAPMIQFFFDGGFWMIPLNLAGIAILVIAIERGYSLFLKRDHSPQNLGKRLLALKFLAVACVLSGVVGTLLGYYSAFVVAERFIEAMGAFPIYEVSRIAMTTSIWGVTLALIAVTTRFVVQAKVARLQG